MKSFQNISKNSINQTSDKLFLLLEQLIRNSVEWLPEKIILQGLKGAQKLTQSEVGFFYFTKKGAYPNEVIASSQKVKFNSNKILAVGLEQFTNPVTHSGLSQINNQAREEFHFSNVEKLVIKNYIIIPTFEADNVAGLLILANSPKGYNEKDMSQMMFYAMNIWMLAEHKRTDDVLKLTESKFKLLTHFVTDFIWSCDLKGKLTYMNLPAISAIGYNQDEIQSLYVPDLLTKDGKAVFKQNFKERLQREKSGIKTDPAEYIIEHVRKDKSTFWAEIRLSPLRNENGEIIGLAGVTRDVTQRLKDEKKLRDSEKGLKEAVAAKDKFLSIIAHDLKSPFSALVGLSEVLLEKHNKMNPDSREEIIRSIFQSTLRTYNLLENLLDWSGMQTGRKVYRPESVDLANLAHDIAELFGEMIKRKNIEFNIFEEQLLKAFADTDMISTVFRNLLSNSLKYTPNGGKISIHIKDYSKTHLQVIFSDTGLGIAKDDINKIFQLDSAISTPGIENEKGTGLGLVLCKEFIEKNEGSIHVKSILNKGTSFYFTLKKA